ncbi:MAG: REP-associated tyrosine transposase [Thermoguttaceae bacterium]
MAEDELRERLLSRVRQLPSDHLPDLAEWLRALECDGLPPLFNTAGSASDEVSRVWKSGDDHAGIVPAPHPKDWPHAPIHRLGEFGTYIVTAGTFHKEHYFRGRQQLDCLEANLLHVAKESGWQLEAWAVFSNHYHFVATALPDSGSLRAALTALHSTTARDANRLDATSDRKVWHNYWDTKLTYEKSYFARLNYVHQNPVKHGLVRVANQYPWCSAAWFERTASPAQVKTIYSFKTDQIRMADDYDPE